MPWAPPHRLLSHASSRWPATRETIWLVGGCGIGLWCCERLSRVLPTWPGPIASLMAATCGLVFLTLPEAARRTPEVARLLADAARPAADVQSPAAPCVLPLTKSREAATLARAHDAVTEPPAPFAQCGAAPGYTSTPPSLAQALEVRLRDDPALMYRVSAWAQALGVSGGHPCGLAYVPQQAGRRQTERLAFAHTQQVILTASLMSFARMQPSRRQSFEAQLTSVIAQHAACLDDCYQMLTYPEQADAISRRIVCPTAAWLSHEAAIKRASQDCNSYDAVALCRLYESAPQRHRRAPDVSVTTLEAYHTAHARTLGAQLNSLWHEAMQQGDAAWPNTAPLSPQSVDDKVNALFDVILSDDVREVWRPFFTGNYLTLGDFGVGQTSLSAVAGDDYVGQLDVIRQTHALRDACEQAEADSFAQQLFGDEPLKTPTAATAMLRETEECFVHAFIVAHMQTLPGAPAPTRGRRRQEHFSSAARSAGGAYEGRLRHHDTDLVRLARECQEAQDLVERADRNQAMLMRALARPNTAERHAACAKQLTGLAAARKQDLARYERALGRHNALIDALDPQARHTQRDTTL